MIFKAYASSQMEFLSRPETGMGYQIIDAKRYGMQYKDRFVVYNSELVIDLDDYFSTYQKEVRGKGYLRSLNEAAELPIEPSTISLVPRHEITEMRYLTESKKKEKGRQSGGKGAADNPKEVADGKELFVRLSAYENDKRIDFSNKKLKPGTYTTTNEDYYTCLRTGDDPIDRYALPNDEMIKWAFYVQPKRNDILQRGIVQPAFDHDGGGREVYFEYGTSEKTYLDKRPYGK